MAKARQVASRNRPAVVHVAGAGPNFMDAAPVVRGPGETGVGQRLVHTDQRYDREVSRVFFEDLGLPDSDWDLQVGSGSRAMQTARILVALERLVSSVRPELLVVDGGVSSTLAAALVPIKRSSVHTRDRRRTELFGLVIDPVTRQQVVALVGAFIRSGATAQRAAVISWRPLTRQTSLRLTARQFVPCS